MSHILGYNVAMIYVFSALFLLIGILAGFTIRDRLFHSMCDNGQLIFKCGRNWVGEDEAFADIRKMFIE